MINRGWTPRIQEPMAYQPRSGLNLDTLRLQLSVLEPDGLLLSLFGACLFSLALMIRFAPLQLQRVNRALGSAAWHSQVIACAWRSQESVDKSVYTSIPTHSTPEALWNGAYHGHGSCGLKTH